MKPLDILLLSIAIGLTFFTAYVLAEGRAVDEEAPPELRNSAFRTIVIHHGSPAATCGAGADRRLQELPYHFVIGSGTGSPDGQVDRGPSWRDQVAAPHTRRKRINRTSIGICLAGDPAAGPPTAKQFRALMDLLEPLCRDYTIPPECILSHREADPNGAPCTDRGLPMNEVRAVLVRMLAGAETPVE